MARMGLGLAAACIAWGVPVQAAETQSYDIAAQDLEAALDGFAATSGKEVLASTDILAGRRSNAVLGDFSSDEALTRLLEGTGLSFELIGGAYVIRSQESGGSAATNTNSGIVVTGTRIRGEDIASARITLDAENMRDQGLATLSDAARTIPQNFGGGQNPNVGINVPAASGVNVSNGSSLNLRGLGSDATLTLLNGHRISYSGSRQSVDLSSIPMGIVDRIELVPDGASAIYGSDAVAGVANIVLRRDADGAVFTGLLGEATEGGNEQRTIGATVGTRWSGGGGILSYEYGFSGALVGYQRSYARLSAARGLDLLPEIERHNLAASLHHEVGRFSVSMDGLYNNRQGLTLYAANSAGDRNGLRVKTSSHNESFSISPDVAVDLGEGWHASVSGTYARDAGHYSSYLFNGSTLLSPFDGCYCNTFWSVEASADGPFTSLPSGPAQLALGTGIRDVGFVSLRGTNSPQNIDEHQKGIYAFGEANLPLLVRGDGAALVRASAAVRFERYPALANVLTPKLGVIASPSPAFDLKATWGRSFRAPTMLQRYEAKFGILVGAASLGGSAYPSGSAALLLSGGRADLEPERARSWSVTADVHPSSLPGARLEVSYFSTRYTDRIVIPIAFTSQSLSNPIYAQQIVLSPTSVAVADAVARVDQFFNITGAVFDPAAVVAIIDNSSVNAAIQRIHGIDAAFTLEHQLGSGSVNAAVYASYLESSQRLTSAQPEFPLAGRLFNPPHFRARAILGWKGELLGLTTAVNRIGGVTDVRMTTPIEVHGMITWDFTARLHSPETTGIAKGLDVTLAVRNLLNEKPSRIATNQVYENPYDSTNYSPVGRYIALSVSKSW